MTDRERRKAASIREIPSSSGQPPLPPFCNLGIWLRLLLGAHALLLLAAAIRSPTPTTYVDTFLDIAALAEPVLLLSLVVLCLADRWLRRLPAAVAPWTVIALCMALAAGIAQLLQPLSTVTALAAALWAGLIAGTLLGALQLLAQANSRALAEARLAALNARIRPHFLYNSLNTVLGLMRSDPRRAETAIEELAELMRALLRDERLLVPLAQELTLARQYLALEKLRLGERLIVRWQIEQFPTDPLVPPLLLQPLIENAIMHGIEPAQAPGVVIIVIRRQHDELLIEISNPIVGARREGQGMALDNIRQRLMLHFDLEARLLREKADGRYKVIVRLPLHAPRSPA